MAKTFQETIFEAINDHTKYQAVKYWGKGVEFDSLDGSATMDIQVAVKLKTKRQVANAKRRRIAKGIDL